MPAARAAAAAGLMLLAGGCAGPGPFGGLMVQDDGDITKSTTMSPLGDLPLALNADMIAARTAAAAMMERDGVTSTPWRNPTTGARGTVTRVAAAHERNGTECRDFLASYVRGKSETWLDGEACRDGLGHWEVRDLRPSLRS